MTTTTTTIDVRRRRFMTVLGGAAAAALAGCGPPPAEELIALLELTGAEREWVTALTDQQVRDLIRGLRAPAGRDRARGAQLLVRMLGERARVCAYARYPAAGLHQRACNGLFRE
jgi:hypothetical protein